MSNLEKNNGKRPRVLIMTSVEAEQKAILDGLGHNDDLIDVCLAGVGIAAAAANTAQMIAAHPYDLVVNAGIAGGFTGQADIGSLVVATEIIAADLGAETDGGFHSLEELQLGQSKFSVDQKIVSSITDPLEKADFSVHAKPVLTLSTVTGTQNTADNLMSRFPTAGAEAMEGFGVAQAAVNQGIPMIEIRAISNAIGPRDRESWKIKEALHILTKATELVMEELR